VHGRMTAAQPRAGNSKFGTLGRARPADVKPLPGRAQLAHTEHRNLSGNPAFSPPHSSGILDLGPVQFTSGCSLDAAGPLSVAFHAGARRCLRIHFRLSGKLLAEDDLQAGASPSACNPVRDRRFRTSRNIGIVQPSAPSFRVGVQRRVGLQGRANSGPDKRFFSTYSLQLLARFME